jgi:hypothetical protein
MEAAIQQVMSSKGGAIAYIHQVRSSKGGSYT